MSNLSKCFLFCSELKECQGLVNNCLLYVYKRHGVVTFLTSWGKPSWTQSWRPALRGYPTYLGSWAINLMSQTSQCKWFSCIPTDCLRKEASHETGPKHQFLSVFMSVLSYSQHHCLNCLNTNSGGWWAKLCSLSQLPSKIQAGELSAGRKDLNPACKWLLAN